MNAAANARVRRARAKLRAQGLRPVQIWVPDIRAPGFAAEAARQCRELAEHPDRELDVWLDDLNRDMLSDLDEAEEAAKPRKAGE